MEKRGSMSDPLKSVVKDHFRQMLEIGLDVKKKASQERKMFKEGISDLQQKLNSLSCKDEQEEEETIRKLQSELLTLDDKINRATGTENELQKQVQKLEEQLKAAMQEEKENNKNRARSAVNIYREISQITWQKSEKPGEIKGFICTKPDEIKTFCFDETKQSQFFITNSLWEMTEDDTCWNMDDEAL
ncbi:unnamed protein product [Lymnaea stagnalis]|uniref:Kinetochore protein Spc24 n=1 Tax=Lymnaea stagnalis TaxID=6523 RepID=A0AAV2H473_LYMST